ncbi:MAG: DUF4258 domain-containing protein [Deltaproteobacteria bacterium]|nr:DUF4258 domain-containing protein [Deltaproteobacteria bacterium]MBW1911483.1 DUF4258 domain-containing protein [Deltaproteobacteria bacterium]MBW2034723.1 DUF4258 domain-containing protein [Deltaproteobacteria bacterium]
MERMSCIEIAKKKVKKGRFYLSHHAQVERGKEEITVDDIVLAILNGRELEQYPDDPRGESCLFVGQGLDSRWIHVLCGSFYGGDLLIITVYVPKLPKWEDPFTRRI